MNDGEWQKVGGGEQADIWDFSKSKSVSGVYTEKRTNLGPKNGTLYILEQPDGSLVGIWEKTALKTKFDSINIGDEVKIEYIGVAKSKNGNNYHNFDVFRRSAGEASSAPSDDDTEDIFNDLP